MPLKECTYVCSLYNVAALRYSYLYLGCTSSFLFWFGGILGSASRAELPVTPCNYAGSVPTLLYSTTHHSLESFIHLKTG